MDGDTQQPSITCDGSQRSCWYHRTLHTHSLPTGQSLAEADVRSYASIFNTWKNNPMHEARKLSHSPAYKYSFNILISNCEEINFKKSHIWPSNTWTAWGLKVFLFAFQNPSDAWLSGKPFLKFREKTAFFLLLLLLLVPIFSRGVWFRTRSAASSSCVKMRLSQAHAETPQWCTGRLWKARLKGVSCHAIFFHFISPSARLWLWIQSQIFTCNSEDCEHLEWGKSLTSENTQ